MVALVVLGLVLIVAGVAVIYWPAAVILAGLSLVAIALLVDPDAFGRSRK